MTAPRTLRHARAASVGAALFLTGLSQPASALQQIQLKELTSTSKLFDGNSDLAELDRATNGAIGRKLVDLFNAPLPLQTKAVVNQAAGSPMLSQALMLLSSLGGVEGLPGNLIDEKISRALDSAAAKGPLTMLTVLPGVVGPDGLGGPESGPVSGAAAGRTARAGGHPAGGPAPVSVDATLSQPCPLMVQRRETKIPVTYRYAALRLVVISAHPGGERTAGADLPRPLGQPCPLRGLGPPPGQPWLTVLLPYHPGSDQSQQQLAMLSGKVPPWVPPNCA